MLSWSIGYPEEERLEVIVAPEAASDHGYEWLSATAKIRSGAFSGSVEMSILYSDLVRFHDQLAPLYKNLKGKAEFRTIEGQLELDVSADRTGHIEVTGFIIDAAGIGNRLIFVLRFDQTILAHTLQELGKCISEIKHR
ncbi:MAG TPA: hypothetical protein VL357_07555 [Rariglobus sp.]|jgi:hypothetical protein|nr:hypothetical protein [Rariglobus sp.]